MNIAYDIPPDVLRHFRRTALVDIDPGLTQMWMSEGQLRIPEHDLYFTIGETVGQSEALVPDCGLRWHYTPPPVFLPAWSPAPSESAAPYTTVTNWWEGWVAFRQESYANSKRDGFLPFLNLPGRTSRPVELAIHLGTRDISERVMLEQRGWRVRDATMVASTPWDYQDYIRKITASSAVRSLPVSALRTPGSATGRYATSQAVSRRWRNTRGGVVFSQRVAACSALEISKRPRRTSRPLPRTTSGTPSSRDSSPKSTSMADRSSDASSRSP